MKRENILKFLFIVISRYENMQKTHVRKKRIMKMTINVRTYKEGKQPSPKNAEVTLAS